GGGGGRKGRGTEKVSGGEREGAPSWQVQSTGESSVDPRQVGGGRRSTGLLERAVRCHHCAEWRHLRFGGTWRPKPAGPSKYGCAHREVLEGREVHQGVGQVGLGAGRVEDAGRPGVRLAGATIDRRSREQTERY